MEYTPPPPQPHSLPRTSQQCRQRGASKVGWPRLLAQYLPPSSDTSTLLNPPSSLQPPPSNSHPRLTPPFPTPGWAPPTSNPTPPPPVAQPCLLSRPAPPPPVPYPLSPPLFLSAPNSRPHPSSTIPPRSVSHRSLSVPSPFLPPSPLHLVPNPSAPHSSGLAPSVPQPHLLASLNSVFRFSLVSDQVYVK